MKPPARNFVVLLISSAAVFAAGRYFPFFTNRAVQGQALARREIALRVLGEYLAAEFAGQNALIVSNPFTQRPGQPREVYAFEDAGIRGLKHGWARKIRLRGIAFPELAPSVLKHPWAAQIDSQTTTPLSFLTVEGAWDSLLAKNPDADLVVSLIGLPANLRSLEIWRQPKPHFALLLPDLRMIGDRADVKEAFRSDKLVAMVLEKPGAPPESAALDRDYHKEFNQRFVLVTSRNIEELTGGPKKFARSR